MSVDFLRDCRIIWKAGCPLKVRIFVWLVRRKMIMTRAWRARWAQEANDMCPLRGVSRI
jgi:hypothetical protein